LFWPFTPCRRLVMASTADDHKRPGAKSQPTDRDLERADAPAAEVSDTEASSVETGSAATQPGAESEDSEGGAVTERAGDGLVVSLVPTAQEIAALLDAGEEARIIFAKTRVSELIVEMDACEGDLAALEEEIMAHESAWQGVIMKRFLPEATSESVVSIGSACVDLGTALQVVERAARCSSWELCKLFARTSAQLALLVDHVHVVRRRIEKWDASVEREASQRQVPFLQTLFGCSMPRLKPQKAPIKNRMRSAR